MKADIRFLDDPQIFKVNQLPAHSDHGFYKNHEERKANASSFSQSLNGTWNFQYSNNAKSRPKNFYTEGYVAKSFDEIYVPGHIELAGYDKLHYINTMYPWEGHIFRRASYSLDRGLEEGSFSEAEYNPVGSYLKYFDLKEGLQNKSVYVCFEGVEQAMYVWLNGHFIGYAEDSFTPTEFDLTPYIKRSGNVLAVEVHKRSTAAFIEDQDFFRFFGIFRNVTLYGKPKIHIEDIWIKPVLEEDNASGKIGIDLLTSFEEESGYVKVTLRDKEMEKEIVLWEKVEIKESISLSPIPLEKVIPWDNHNPYLYQVLIEVYDKTAKLVEVIPNDIGFRRVEIKEKIMLLNGKRLIINGVNRHEWSANRGRSVTVKEMKKDIEIIRKNNINAVRTSHYPNQILWYDLCDQNGIYLMAEANLESHGSWQKMGQVEPSWNIPGSISQWKEVVVDRARTNFEVFKNHTSILFWSLGNESYAEENIIAMNQFYKEKDNSRLVHYEGVFHNRSYEDSISDMESRMYTNPMEIRKYLETSPKKPFILCEYMHDMGNSLGGIKSYIDLIEDYEMYQGGFIWDYIDQALWVKDEVTGEMVLRYGGDFDDKPSDYEFSANGIIFADRSEKPAMQEVKYYYGKYS